MGDYNLSAEEANLAKHLLVNIAHAVCSRLDVIDDQLEGICESTKCLEDQLHELVGAQQQTCLKHRSSSLSARKQRKKESESMNSPAVNVIHLNKEEDIPDGSWLGDENNPCKRVRVCISPRQLERINLSCTSAIKMALLLLDYLVDRNTQAVSNVNGTGKLGKHRLDPLVMYGIYCHLEHRFRITTKDWKRIQVHIDSKCRSAYRSKSRGLPFRHRVVQQTESCIDGLETSYVESCSDDTEPQPQQNSLVTEDEPTSDWALETSACHLYATDESGATVRLVCIPVSQAHVDSSTVNCVQSEDVTAVSQMSS